MSAARQWYTHIHRIHRIHGLLSPQSRHLFLSFFTLFDFFFVDFSLFVLKKTLNSTAIVWLFNDYLAVDNGIVIDNELWNAIVIDLTFKNSITVIIKCFIIYILSLKTNWLIQ